MYKIMNKTSVLNLVFALIYKYVEFFCEVETKFDDV